jgi:hypothetical protein
MGQSQHRAGALADHAGQWAEDFHLPEVLPIFFECFHRLSVKRYSAREKTAHGRGKLKSPRELFKSRSEICVDDPSRETVCSS